MALMGGVMGRLTRTAAAAASENSSEQPNTNKIAVEEGSAVPYSTPSSTMGTRP
jgi:hypothetical protein